MYPLGDRGGLCVAQHGSFNWEKPGLCFFLNVPCIHMQPFARPTGARQDAYTLHGIESDIIIVRVEQFRRPLVTLDGCSAAC